MKLKAVAKKSTSKKGTNIYAAEYAGLKKIPEYLSSAPVLLSKESIDPGEVVVADRPMGIDGLDDDGKLVLSWYV